MGMSKNDVEEISRLAVEETVGDIICAVIILYIFFHLFLKDT